MVNRKSWEEFRSSGLLWFINSILQVFGWSIVYELDEETKLIESIYPVRTRYRGFSENINTNGYVDISRYMKDNAEELYKESME